MQRPLNRRKAGKLTYTRVLTLGMPGSRLLALQLDPVESKHTRHTFPHRAQAGWGGVGGVVGLVSLKKGTDGSVPPWVATTIDCPVREELRAKNKNGAAQAPGSCRDRRALSVAPQPQ